MKSRKLSNAERMRRTSNYKIPIRLTRSEDGFELLQEKAERRSYNPELILVEAKKAVYWAAKYLGKWQSYQYTVYDDDTQDDARSFVVQSWYEIHGDDLGDFRSLQKTMYKCALNFLHRAHKRTVRMTRPDPLNEWETAYAAVDYHKKHGSDQETRIMAIQAANVVNSLPQDLHRMAMKMVDGCSLPEAAEELDIDLYAAMKLQKEVRIVALRIIEAGGASNMFSDPDHHRKVDA